MEYAFFYWSEDVVIVCIAGDFRRYINILKNERSEFSYFNIVYQF